MKELTFQDLVDFVDGNRGAIAPETLVYMNPVVLFGTKVFGTSKAIEVLPGDTSLTSVVVIS